VTRLVAIVGSLALTACSFIVAHPPDAPRRDQDCDFPHRLDYVTAGAFLAVAGGLASASNACDERRGNGDCGIEGLAAAASLIPVALYALSGLYGSVQSSRCRRARAAVVADDERQTERDAETARLVEEFHSSALRGDCVRALEVADVLWRYPAVYEQKIQNSALLKWCKTRPTE